MSVWRGREVGTIRRRRRGSDKIRRESISVYCVLLYLC